MLSIALLLLPSILAQHLDEPIYTINSKRAIHTVSEKFLSYSVDPAILLTGLNLTDATLQMARRLSPAYVRVAGPSTRFVQYEDENWKSDDQGVVAVTPTMWFGINEWLASANLTPVFGINDAPTSKERWNPQETMKVLDLADKFNVSCYWQLGYDCSNKTQEQYESDLKRLQHVLDAFPDKKDHWKIVASDLTECVSDPGRVLDDLSDVLVAAVIENGTNAKNNFLLKPKVPLWITSPKPQGHLSFVSALSWAKETGEAAKNGYEVVLRQPRLHEIYTEAPPFWVSLLHKMLMGRNVLEVRALPHPELWVYAHCTKHQNDFIRSGAMTVLVVNNATTNHTIILKFGTLLFKSIEVQSYILTAEGEDATDVFLNGDKLSWGKIEIVPKLRRARTNYLSLFLPPKSIGFFVLPGAQIQACMNEEADLKVLMEEINEDQNIPFSEQVALEPRFSLRKTPTLGELQKKMEKELESDERYYRQMRKKKTDDSNGRNLFIHRVKHPEFKLGHRQQKEEPKKVFELELTSAEIRKVLTDRAKVKASRKNIIFTSEELEEIMNKATQKFLNNKNTSIRIRKKSKREANRDKKDINMRLLKLKSFGDRRNFLRDMLRNKKERVQGSQRRDKRDINMHLLKLKTEMAQNKHKKMKKDKFENFEEKQATVWESGQISEELDDDDDEEEESFLPDKDVFAELADPEELFFATTTEKSLKGLLHRVPKIEVAPLKLDPEQRTVFDDFQLTSGDLNFDCIHDFCGSGKIATEKENSSELWEAWVQPEEEKGSNYLPSFRNRMKEVNFEEKRNFEDSMNNDYEDLESDESSPVRLKRNVNLQNEQFKFLKERLTQRKKLHFLNKFDRQSRSLSDKDSFNDRYKSLTERLKIWKPWDILTLKAKNARKVKRSVDHTVDSVENEIGLFLKEVMKDGKLDKDDGDYRLVFPNQDKLEVVENKKSGDTEVKLVLHDGEGRSNIQKISKKQNDSVWNQLYQKLSKFFQGLSSKLKKCIMEDLLNGS